MNFTVGCRESFVCLPIKEQIAIFYGAYSVHNNPATVKFYGHIDISWWHNCRSEKINWLSTAAQSQHSNSYKYDGLTTQCFLINIWHSCRFAAIVLFSLTAVKIHRWREARFKVTSTVCFLALPQAYNPKLRTDWGLFWTRVVICNHELSNYVSTANMINITIQIPSSVRQIFICISFPALDCI